MPCGGAVMTPATFTAYRAARDAGDAREERRLLGELVVEYEHLVAVHARRLARGDFPDLMQAGRMAMCQAIEQYDPARGDLRSIADKKILSEMQRHVIGPRAQVSSSAQWAPMTKRLRRACEAFAAKHGRSPTAEDLGIDPEKFAAWTEGSTYAPYEETPDEDHAQDAVVAASTSPSERTPAQEVERAMAKLSPVEVRIFTAIALEGRTQWQVAETEGLHQPEVSLMYAAIIESLKHDLL